MYFYIFPLKMSSKWKRCEDYRRTHSNGVNFPCRTIQVNRRFQDLICNSPVLQHRCELFAAGLIENPCNPCDLAQGRKLCKDYVQKWSKAATMIKSTHKLPPDQASRWNDARQIGRNMLVSFPTKDHGLGFLHIPPVKSREPVDTWSIPPFPFELFGLAVYHPENLLAAAECDGG
jgi:hypothetical protein